MTLNFLRLMSKIFIILDGGINFAAVFENNRPKISLLIFVMWKNLCYKADVLQHVMPDAHFEHCK